MHKYITRKHGLVRTRFRATQSRGWVMTSNLNALYARLIDGNKWEYVEKKGEGGELQTDVNFCGRVLTYIKESGIQNAGNGLYAAVDLKEGQIIGFYSGTVVDDAGDDHEAAYRQVIHVRNGHTDTSLIVDPLIDKDIKHLGMVHMINDCITDPGKNNVYFTYAGFCKTKRPVKKDEELFVSYGWQYWNTDLADLLDGLFILVDSASDDVKVSETECILELNASTTYYMDRENKRE